MPRQEKPDAAPAVAAYLLSLAAVVVLILATTPALPAVVASHFGADNLANGRMTRSHYQWFMLAFTIVLPALACLPLGWLPARFPQLVNIPHREFWLADAQLAATVAFFRRQAFRLATLLVLFMGAIHLLIVEANAVQPARLPLLPFVVVLGSFLIGVLWWGFTLTSRFRRRPT